MSNDKQTQQPPAHTCYKITNWPHYNKALSNKVEVVCFLNDPPHLRVDTYSNDTPSGRIEIDALKNHYPRISEDEYKTAFAKATATNFKIL